MPAVLVTILNDGSNMVIQARWGLIPAWSKDPAIGNRLANARSESIESKPSFRVQFRKKRAIVLADGFYEWQNRPGSKLKVPWYFRLTSREVFGFAAIWDVWRNPEGKELTTVCLITTAANKTVEPVHVRMPCILESRFIDIWLSSDDHPVEKLKECLEPYSNYAEVQFSLGSPFVSPAQSRPQDCRLIPTETPSKATANSRVALQRSKKPLHVHANICKQKMAFLDSLRRFEAERGFYIRQNCNNLGVFAVSRFGFRDQPVQPLWHPSASNVLRNVRRPQPDFR
jgi:putative SOS response-associated peptidase YedK